MTKKNKVIPARDANENSKAFRQRIKMEAQQAKEKELEEARKKAEEAQFRQFVTDKREDYVMTTLGSILQNPATDVSKVEENVNTACVYADVLLRRLHNVRKISDAPKPEATAPDPAPEAPAGEQTAGEQTATPAEAAQPEKPAPKKRTVRAGGSKTTK